MNWPSRTEDAPPNEDRMVRIERLLREIQDEIRELSDQMRRGEMYGLRPNDNVDVELKDVK